MNMNFMNMQKSRLILVLGLGLIMIQYQNCSSVPNELLNSQVAHAGDLSVDAGLNQKSQQQGQDGELRAIDPISVGELLFPETEVSINGDVLESLSLIGICGQNGSFIGWQIYTEDGELAESGLTPCDFGSFQISSTRKMDSYCNQSLRVSASLGVKAVAEVSVSVLCQ